MLLRSSRLLNLLELSSQGNIASGSIAIVGSRVGVHELSSTDIQSAAALAVPSPTSELITFVSGDHVLQTFDLAISGQMLVGQGLSFLVFGEVTGFGIAQVDVNGNFLLDLRLLSLGKAYIRPVSFCQIIKVNGIPAIQIADTIAAGITFPVVVIRISQLRSTLLRRCSNVTFLNYMTILISKRDMNGFYVRFCKRCKRYAHDNHEHGRQQSQQTSFEIRFLHVNFSYSLNSLKFI